MKQNSSSRRVNEQARQLIAETLLFEFSDARLSDVTITGCEVSFDRSICNVYYSTSPESLESAALALEKSAKRLRYLLTQKLSWRTSPKLRFFRDVSVDEAEKVSRALQAERQHFSELNAQQKGEDAFDETGEWASKGSEQ